jgi:O-antigen/teichoic acid export membrane protein
MLSMVIVIPLLSYNTQIYGIYVLCVSINSFLQYTDLGFLSAGQKYASEYFAFSDTNNEIKMLSFVHFIMFIFLILCIFIILFFSWEPKYIISDLNDSSRIVASYLFFILGVSSPIILCQRFAQSVFTIRIQDDIYQRIDLIFSILKIACIYFFQKNNSVDIVSYFIFTQFLNFITVIVSFGIIKYKYQYDFKLVFKSFKFDKPMYIKSKTLAFSTIISTISWIIFFQLDSFIISKTLGINNVAIYAIPFFLLSFVNSLYNTIYYPFLFRFNYLIVSKNYNKLYDFILKIFEVTFPIFILPVTILILLMKPLILSWVGADYFNSILIGQTLIASLYFIFIVMPYTYLLLSLEKIKILNINSIILPLIFLLLTFLLKNSISLLALAIAKSVAFFISSVYLYFSIKINNFNFFRFFSRRILSVFFSITVLFLLNKLFSPYLQVNYISTFSFFKTIFLGLLMFTLSFIVYLFFSKDLYSLGKNILIDILTKKGKSTI